MDNFDLRKYLAEGKLLKEDLIDKIKKLKDYNKTEDSLKYKKYDITYDKDENLYSVFLKKGSGDSSDMPEFESSSPEKVKKYLAEGRLLKEDISSHKKEAKRFLEKFIDDNKDEFEFIPDLETGYIDAKDNSYNVDELASIFLDIGQDIPRGKYNQKYKGEGGTYVVVAENKLLKEESAGVFIGWADDMLGMEEPTFPKGTELKLRSKADAGKTSLTYYFQLADKKGDGNLQMYITVGDEPSIKYRANNLDDSKVKAYIDKRKDDFVRRFDFIAEQNSKEEMGKKYHVGSGYEDKVTDEDVASIKDGIKKLKSLKIETF